MERDPPWSYTHGAVTAPASKTEILDVNRRYHDVAADEYDAKWGLSFAPNGQEQVVG